MKNTFKLLAIVAFVFMAFATSAQTAKPIKLGHLDIQKLMSVMPEAKEAEKTLETKRAEIQKELQAMYENHQKLVQEYQANAKTYTDLVRANKEQEIQGLTERIQKFQEMADQQLQTTYNTLMGQIMEKIQKAAQEVGKEHGFTYIFTQNALLFAADNSEDILPLVKKKLGIQ